VVVGGEEGNSILIHIRFERISLGFCNTYYIFLGLSVSA
jgi:hypothetical protein